MKSYQLPRRRQQRALLLALTLAATSGPALAQGEGTAKQGEVPPLRTRIETHTRLSQDRQIVTTSIWSPLQQEENRVLYGDLRVMEDDLGSREANLGLGVRKLEENAVWGGYVYADRRVSPAGSLFWQTTLGIERLGTNWDARANAYIPLSGARSYLTSLPSGPSIAGSGIYTTGAGYLVEEPQPGLDAEIGYRVWGGKDWISELWLYGGGYAFFGDKTPEVIGARARAKLEVTSWLDLGLRVQHDGERETQTFLEATVRYPGERLRRTGLAGRLDDSPERDVDIVTGNAAPPPDQQPVINTLTGEPQRILYVDNTAAAGGDGSTAHPWANLADAQAVLQPGDIVYIRAGDGTSSGMNAGLRLETENVILQGQGAALTFDGSRMQTVDGLDYEGWVLAPAGDRPILSNTGGDGVIITAAGAVVRGLQIDGASGNGLVVEGQARDVRLEDLRLTGNGGDGLVVRQTGAGTIDLTVQDTTITGNLGNGITLEDTGTGTLRADLGNAVTPGGNNIFGNRAGTLSVDTDGETIAAEGNYWGGGAPGGIVGPDAVNLVATTFLGTGLCPDCGGPVGFALTDETGVAENHRITSASFIAQGFRGTRYIEVSGAGNPELIINGTATGTAVAAIRAGDSVAVALTSSTLGLETHSARVVIGDQSERFDVQTRFLPNAVGGLIGWWDAADINGDFLADNNLVDGTQLMAWADKSGFGNTATSTGGARPTYQTDVQAGLPGVGVDTLDDHMTVSGSGTLSAMTQDMTLLNVFSGDPAASGTPWFEKGSCSGLSTSRCLVLREKGTSGEGQIRLDTSAARNQIMTATGTQIFNGTTHLVTTRVDSGSAQIFVGGALALSGTYSSGSGFGASGTATVAGALGGYYFETLLFGTAISTENQALLETYLNEKWELP